MSYHNRCPKWKKEKADELRRNMTLAEDIIWDKLIARKCDFKIKPQVLIAGYIVDFYCPSRKLIIEIDGESHTNKKEYDKKRDNNLSKFGFKTIRFSNEMVFNELERVISLIKKELFYRFDSKYKIDRIRLPSPKDYKLLRKIKKR